MKKNLLFILPTLLFLVLSGCSSNKKTSNDSSSKSDESEVIDDPYDTKTQKYADQDRKDLEGDINIYAINDFHGDVVGSTGMGIIKVASYLKNKKSSENAVLINSGDLWQGAIESNYNRGKLLTEVSNAVEFDCMAVGNHEFDWGQQYVRENDEIADPDTGYSVPTLACNVYTYNIETKTDGVYANLGAKYVIKDLDNGIRVGIIGGIGYDQITSITSQFVDDITFKQPLPIVKSLSDVLRTKKGCNVVLLSLHADQDDAQANNYEITDVSPVSGFKYVDAVFCAHTHEDETSTHNGVPFIQSSAYGKLVGNIKLHLNQNGSCSVLKCENISNLGSIVYDTKISNIVTKYKAESDVRGNEVIGKMNGNFYSSGEMANFVCTAIADYCVENDINVDFTLTNYARKTIYNSGDTDLTYAKLYEAVPFDNEIYIAEVSGEDFLNVAKSSYFYRFRESGVTNISTLKIAVIDYVALHRNADRDYDRFPSLKIIDKITVEGYALYNYRDMTEKYVREYNGHVMYASDYISTNRYDRSYLSQKVTLAEDPLVGKGDVYPA